MPQKSGHRIAADIGGTFTDIALLTPDGHLATGKLPSTPANYADAVVAGVVALMQRLGLPIGDIAEVLHGCTVATNAILEHKGARTALITTQGFRDVLELRRIRVPAPLRPALAQAAAAGAAPPALRGRRAHRRRRLDRPPARRGEPRCRDRRAARRRDVEAIAVCLLHSYANPVHEQRDRRAAARASCPAASSRSRSTCCRRSASTSAPARP